MQLYEATNGFTGYGPVRFFVWAEDREEASKKESKKVSLSQCPTIGGQLLHLDAH
ncbi:hypothetical protein [Metabacillus fastidiosus]|uniref:hypothetical protein n=1 Tax=Metabacillus fastidiosus TaxID=1458 RepID=UPI003D2CF9E9